MISKFRIIKVDSDTIDYYVEEYVEKKSWIPFVKPKFVWAQHKTTEVTKSGFEFSWPISFDTEKKAENHIKDVIKSRNVIETIIYECTYIDGQLSSESILK